MLIKYLKWYHLRTVCYWAQGCHWISIHLLPWSTVYNRPVHCSSNILSCKQVFQVTVLIDSLEAPWLWSLKNEKLKQARLDSQILHCTWHWHFELDNAALMAQKHCSLLTLQVFILKHLIVKELCLNVVVINGLICFQFVSLVTHCNKEIVIELWVFDFCRKTITSVAFSGDGKYLATGEVSFFNLTTTTTKFYWLQI